MNQALLDTDIYSEILKGINPTVKANAVAYRTVHGVLTLSAVTLMEVLPGYYQKQALRQLQAFLTNVAVEEVLPFDRATAEPAGRIAGELERTGQPIGLADPMIAAIALTYGLELVSGNTAHFQRVKISATPSRWSTGDRKLNEDAFSISSSGQTTASPLNYTMTTG